MQLNFFIFLQVKNLQTAVPKAIESINDYKSKLDALAENLTRVTALVDDLRNKLAKARDLANRVTISLLRMIILDL